MLYLVFAVSNVSAYDGGLLNGITGYDNKTGAPITAATDNDESTYHYTLWGHGEGITWVLDTTARVEYYKLRYTSPNNEFYVLFYDHNDKLLLSTLAGQTGAVELDNVKKVVLENRAIGHEKIVWEFDIFGEYDLQIPVNLKATGLVKSIQLQWDAVPDTKLTGYRIYMDDQPIANVSKAQTSYLVEKLEPDKRHKFHVVAVYDNLMSGASNAVTSYALAELAKPVTLKAVPFSSKVDLSWTTNGAVKYKLFNGDKLLYEGLNTAYTHMGLETDQMYMYHVISVDQYGREQMSNVVSVQTFEPPPPKPFDLRITKVDHKSASIAWDRLNPPYTVYLDGEVIADDLQGNSYTLNGLTHETDYVVKVTYLDLYGQLATSNDLKVRTTSLPLPKTLELKLVSKTHDNVRLQWTSSFASYKLLQNGQEIYSTVGTLYTVTGLNDATEYTYQVLAVDEFGRTVLSNELVVKTNSEPPPPTTRPQPTPPPKVSDTGNVELDEANDHLVAGANDTKHSFMSLISIIISIFILIVGTLFLIRVFKRKMAKASTSNLGAAGGSTSASRSSSKPKVANVALNKSAARNYNSYRSSRSSRAIKNYNPRRRYYVKKRTY